VVQNAVWKERTGKGKGHKTPISILGSVALGKGGTETSSKISSPNNHKPSQKPVEGGGIMLLQLDEAKRGRVGDRRFQNQEGRGRDKS